MKIVEYIRTIISYLLIGIAGIICLPPCFIIACLPARYRYDNPVFFFIADLFYKAVVYASLNRWIIKGKENLPKGAAIFVANHQSSFDIPVLGALCNGFPHVWLVLELYLKSPVIGFFIRRMFIAVDQSNPAKAARSLIQVYRFTYEKQRHLLIFPEGGRYPSINTFFEGFAIVARKTGRPVIPVYMPNNGKIFPPFSFLIHSYPVATIIGQPFTVASDETDADFVRRVRQWFLDRQAER